MISKRKIRKEVSSAGENYAEKNHVHSQYATHDEVNSSNGNGNPNSYTHPASHPATMIEQDETHRFVTDTEKSTWDGKSELELGETSTTAYAGDKGKAAYDHSQTAHAPSNAQANNISDVNAAALTGGGETSLHSHAPSGLTQAQVLTRNLGC